ncbi:MAG: hypothetical protein K1X55_01835 [Chitinophagales bacterium]|nr:hypothetical protein [Chitinophagales bacterium]
MDEKVELTASLGGKGSFILSLQDSIFTNEVIYVSTTLHNLTNDTIQFISWSCSYEYLFKTNSDSFNVQSRFDCFCNFPFVMQIPPKSKIDHFIMINQLIENINLSDKKLRIGMRFIEPQKENNLEDIIKAMKNAKDDKILWSNEINLGHLYRQVYK